MEQFPKPPTARSSKPLISVCIVAYNHERYIRDAVLSAVLQCRPALYELEIIIGNDCSTDATSAILDELGADHGASLQIVHRPTNLGAVGNYLDLISRARGEFVAHLDGDDFWLPGKIEAQFRFLRDHPECGVVYTSAVVMTTEGRLQGAFSDPQPSVFGVDYLIEKGNFLNQSSMFYRSAFKHALLSTPVPFIDYMSHVTLSKLGMLGHINYSYVLYRVSTETSMTKVMPDLVRDLYFQAFWAGLDAGSPAVRHQAAANYLASAWLGSLIQKDAFLGSRARKLVSDFNLRVPLLAVLFVMSLASKATSYLAAAVSRIFSRGTFLSVAYPRR